jgi:hypothetical protein
MYEARSWHSSQKVAYAGAQPNLVSVPIAPNLRVALNLRALDLRYRRGLGLTISLARPSCC